MDYIVFSISDWGIDLNHRDNKQFALEMNWDHSVIFFDIFKILFYF